MKSLIIEVDLSLWFHCCCCCCCFSTVKPFMKGSFCGRSCVAVAATATACLAAAAVSTTTTTALSLSPLPPSIILLHQPLSLLQLLCYTIPCSNSSHITIWADPIQSYPIHLNQSDNLCLLLLLLLLLFITLYHCTCSMYRLFDSYYIQKLKPDLSWRGSKNKLGQFSIYWIKTTGQYSATILKIKRSFQQTLLGQTGFLIFYIIFLSLSLSLSASAWNGDWRCSISVISATAACNMICFYFIIFIPYEYRIPWLKLFFQSFNLKIWSLIFCTHLQYKMLCVWCRELKLNTEHSAQQQQNVLLTIPWCLQQQQNISRKSTWLLNMVVQ